MASKRACSKKGAPIEDRLRLHMIEAPSGCWIWVGAASHGRGSININGRRAVAYRVSYETFVGPIPDGLQIDHLCRRPRCINPRHLQAVTARVNVLRGTSPGARARRRDICLKGHPYAEHARIDRGFRICAVCRDETNRRHRDEDRGPIPAQLRAARKALGITQSAVADAMGIRQPDLSGIENGHRKLHPQLVADLWSFYDDRVSLAGVA